MRIMAQGAGQRRNRRLRAGLDRQRQAEAKAGALALLAVDPDLAAHHLNQPFGDRQPQAGALELAVALVLDLVELAEDVADLLLRDADAGVLDVDMQVARLLEDGTTGRWAGKLRQMRVALALERRLSKDQILTLYLTHAPYGGAAEGIRAATYSWFGKEPNRLTPAEAALLVALPQSPGRRRPDRFPDAASEARNRVLARMQRQGIVTAEQAEAARRTPLPHRMIRAGLEALIDRKSFYRLAELGEHHDGWFGVWSNGEFFSLIPSAELDAE